MALTERHRSVLYQRLNEVVHDEEAVGAMLSHFSARDIDEPATKDFVRAEVAAIHAEVAAMKDFVRAEMADLEQRLITFVHQEIRSSMRWTIGFLVSTQASLVAALAVFN